MTTRERLINYIQRDLLSDRLDVSLAAEDNLLVSGLIDSLGVMSLIAFIETELGIPVPPEDVTIENFVSVERIDAYLARGRDGELHG